MEARKNSDFSMFAPYLTHNLELARRYADCFDEFDSRYDVLLDDYEPGMKSAEVARLFEELSSELVPLIATVSERPIDDSLLHGSFPIDRQRRLARNVVELMGFDPQSWRIDDAVHPFATSFGSVGCSDHDAVGRDVFRLLVVRRHARVRPRPLRGRDR